MPREHKQDDNDLQGGSTPFWRSIPGVLTQVATALTAVAGILAVVNGVFKQPDDYTEIECRPIVEEPRALTLVPLSLKNSFHGHEPLYWFKISGENVCPEPVFLKVEFKVRQGPVRSSDEPAVFTIAAGETFEFRVDPSLELLNDSFREPVVPELTWTIYNDQEQVLHQGTEKIEFHPKNVFYWAYEDADGRPVAKEFLLASLTAWTLSRNSELLERSLALRAELSNGVHEGVDPDGWFRLCYEEILARLIELPGPLTKSFPPKTQTSIRPPADLLRAVSAKPIEGALLLGALSHWLVDERGLRIALVIPGGEGHLYFSWSAHDPTGCAWKAIDVTSAGESSFGDNLRTASAVVCSLLESKPDIVRTLDENGVFYAADEHSVAVDFPIARDRFKIRGLP